MCVDVPYFIYLCFKLKICGFTSAIQSICRPIFQWAPPYSDNRSEQLGHSFIRNRMTRSCSVLRFVLLERR